MRFVKKKNIRSKSKPTVAIPKATEFNSTVAVDLKIHGDKYMIWMVCACTRFIQGRVLNDKNPESIVTEMGIGRKFAPWRKSGNFGAPARIWPSSEKKFGKNIFYLIFVNIL